jgi:hypothetical protein
MTSRNETIKRRRETAMKVDDFMKEIREDTIEAKKYGILQIWCLILLSVGKKAWFNAR